MKGRLLFVLFSVLFVLISVSVSSQAASTAEVLRGTPTVDGQFDRLYGSSADLKLGSGSTGSALIGVKTTGGNTAQIIEAKDAYGYLLWSDGGVLYGYFVIYDTTVRDGDAVTLTVCRGSNVASAQYRFAEGALNCAQGGFSSGCTAVGGYERERGYYYLEWRLVLSSAFAPSVYAGGSLNFSWTYENDNNGDGTADNCSASGTKTDTVTFSASAATGNGTDSAYFPIGAIDPVTATSGLCGSGVRWAFDVKTGVLTISGKGEMTDYSTYAVAPWHYDRTRIRKVVISDGVTYVSSQAFLSCTALERVEIAPSVTAIAQTAFSGCNSTMTVAIPCIRQYSVCNGFAVETVHQFGHWTVTQNPSVQAQGKASRVCPNHTNQVENAVLPVLSESNGYGYYVVTSPKCTADGVGRYSLVKNGQILAFDVSIPMLNHAYGTWTVKTAPTESATGRIQRICANDDSHVETEALPILSTANGYTRTTVSPATCTVGEKVRYAKMLHEQTFTFDVTGNPLNHSYGSWTVYAAPTETAVGSLRRICSRDNTHVDSFILPKLQSGNGYTYQVESAPTFQSTGVGSYTLVKDKQTFRFTVTIPKLTAAISITNSAFTTAWGCSFTTVLTASQISGTGCSVTVSYDPLTVTLKDAEASSGVTITKGTNSITLTCAKQITANSKLATLTFTTSDEAASGEYAFLSLVNGGNNTASFTKLKIYQIGDVNMDGVVNSRDVTLIKQSVVKMITLTDVQKVYANAYSDYDTAGRDSISARDATLITQAVVKMPVTLGDRVTLTFKNGNTTLYVRTVHKGKNLTQIPTPPSGYVWSQSAESYVAPDYRAITANRTYYLRASK